MLGNSAEDYIKVTRKLHMQKYRLILQSFREQGIMQDNKMRHRYLNDNFKFNTLHFSNVKLKPHDKIVMMQFLQWFFAQNSI